MKETLYNVETAHKTGEDRSWKILNSYPVSAIIANQIMAEVREKYQTLNVRSIPARRSK